MTKEEFTERWLQRQAERKKDEAAKRKEADRIHQAFKSAAINYLKSHYKRGVLIVASVCRTIRRHMKYEVKKQRNRLEWPVRYQRGHKKRSWLSRLWQRIKRWFR